MKLIDLASSTADRFGTAMRDHLERVEDANAGPLGVVAAKILEVIEGDGLLYVGGTGHSIGLVLETFYRAGGLACVQPLYHSSLLPLHGARESSLCEHAPGLARLVVENLAPGPSDLGFIFSNSGVNAVPVELAQELSRLGAPVVAVVSLTHLRAAPRQAGGKIDEVADYILDTLVPYGDATYPTGDGATTAGLSSLTGVYLWNLLLARVADRATERGLRLPLWTSSNVAGGAEQNAVLFSRYCTRVPTL